MELLSVIGNVCSIIGVILTIVTYFLNKKEK